MAAIALCRTAALGGHVETCDDCALSCVAYNSCRNRHCPKCQGAARDRWLADREADLLPVPYFHVVFTVPAEIAAIAYQNKRQLCLRRSELQHLRTFSWTACWVASGVRQVGCALRRPVAATSHSGSRALGRGRTSRHRARVCCIKPRHR